MDEKADNRAGTLLLDLRDTAGQARFQAFRNQELERLSPHACLICFSTVDQKSFVNARSGWIKLARTLFPRCPVVLVGTKSDLRGRGNGWEVDVNEAHRLAHKWNSQYIECSAYTGDKLKWLFDQVTLSRGIYLTSLKVIVLMLDPPRTSGCSCTII